MKMCLGLKKWADRWTEELELLSFVLVFFSIPLCPLHSISLHSTPLQLDSFLLILSFFFLLSSFFFFDSELWGTYLPTPDPPEKDLCQAIVWHDSAKLFDVNFCGHQQNFLTSKNFQTIQTFQLSDRLSKISKLYISCCATIHLIMHALVNQWWQSFASCCVTFHLIIHALVLARPGSSCLCIDWQPSYFTYALAALAVLHWLLCIVLMDTSTLLQLREEILAHLAESHPELTGV